jgi:HK97 family phage portal protein
MGLIDLWDMTTLYQEVLGQAYWYVELDEVLHVPQAIWILPAQNVTPRRDPHSPNLVDYYEYKSGARSQQFPPGQIIHFRYPNPRNPYLDGLSPLRAAFEQVSLASDYAAFKKAKFENNAIPDALISPDEVIGEEERDRLETQWNMRFRRGGTGKVVVTDSAMKVQLLNHSMGDLAALAEQGATKELIANAFHVPIAFWTSNTNLANLYASLYLHASTAIMPRLKRRDETINAQLIPLFDLSGRLYVDSGDPTPTDPAAIVAENERDLKYGVRSINEVRSDNGYPPAPWGDTPWVPGAWAPMDIPRMPTARGLAPEKGK